MKRFFTLLLSLAMVFSLAAPVWAAGPSFRDVPDTHWAYAYVERAAQEGWINGIGNGQFGVDDKVSYDQFFTMVVRAFFQDELAAYSGPDTPWSRPYVTVAYELGIITPVTNMDAMALGEWNIFFENSRSVNRAEMASIVSQTLFALGVKVDYDKADIAASIPDHDDIYLGYEEHILTCVAAGIITGVDARGTFDGYGFMTRAQAATVLCRLYDYVNGGQEQLPEEPKEPEETKAPVPEESQQPEETKAPAPEESKPSTGSSIDITAWEREVFDLVNEIRVENGLAEFEYDDTLADVARAHSQDMIDRNFFDHYNPDGASPFDRMKAAGIRYTMAAENIAAGYPSPESVVEGWMNSPGHRANILSGNKYLGVGLALGGGYGYYWTQCFAKY